MVSLELNGLRAGEIKRHPEIQTFLGGPETTALLH